MDAADRDIAQAIERQWAAFPELATLVPGLLQRGRLSSYQPGSSPPIARLVPYAQLTVTKTAPGMHQTSPSAYIDIRRATIKVYGLEAAVAPVLAYIRENTVFNRQTLNTQARFMACTQDGDGTITQDEERKQGEDVWVGTIDLDVWTQRNE